MDQSNTQSSHEFWMSIALEEAEKALEAGEIPIGGVLVGGNELISRTQTQVVRHGSIAAHGELFALLEAKGQVWTASRPLVLYTTLEPCIMCLGAMMQCTVDEVVYAMKCEPDGGVFAADMMREAGQPVPTVVAGVLEDEAVALFRKWSKPEDHPAYAYVQALLAPYNS